MMRAITQPQELSQLIASSIRHLPVCVYLFNAYYYCCCYFSSFLISRRKRQKKICWNVWLSLVCVWVRACVWVCALKNQDKQHNATIWRKKNSLIKVLYWKQQKNRIIEQTHILVICALPNENVNDWSFEHDCRFAILSLIYSMFCIWKRWIILSKQKNCTIFWIRIRVD